MEKKSRLENSNLSQEQFLKQINNFPALFSSEERYRPAVTKFLKEHFPTEFEDLRAKFEKSESNTPLRKQMIEENINILYRMYLALKQRGNFPDDVLGLQRT